MNGLIRDLQRICVCWCLVLAPLLLRTPSSVWAALQVIVFLTYGHDRTNMNTSDPYRWTRAGSVGFPFAKCEFKNYDPTTVKLLPNGVSEIEVRGPNVLKATGIIAWKNGGRIAPRFFYYRTWGWLIRWLYGQYCRQNKDLDYFRWLQYLYKRDWS